MLGEGRTGAVKRKMLACCVRFCSAPLDRHLSAGWAQRNPHARQAQWQ